MTLESVHNAIQENFENIMIEADKERLSELKKCEYKERISNKDITDISKIMINSLVNCIVKSSAENLAQIARDYDIEKGGENAKRKLFLDHNGNEPDIKNAIGFIIMNPEDDAVKAEQEQNKERLTRYPHIISEKVHHSCGVERMNAKGQYIIKKLFQAYYSHPQQLPDNAIIRYMLDIAKYEDFNDAIKDGIGAVRENFDKQIQSRDGVEMERKIKLMRVICDHIAGMTDHYAIEEYKKLYE